jgi:uncharacterized MnhB-related membrane protein
MGVWVRIIMYIISGALIDRGLISPALGSYLRDNPDVAIGIEALLGGFILVVTLVFRNLAYRLGWSR